MIRFVLFDMDHTLLDADCDLTWKEFAIRHRLAPESDRAESLRFMEDYDNGCMDEAEFNRFQLRDFAGRTPQEMAQWAKLHFEEFLLPAVRPKAVECVRACLASGIPAAILSSTNSVLVKPVAEHFGFRQFFSTELELKDGRYTGAIAGAYRAGNGKVALLQELAASLDIPAAHFAAYGDSVNDLPLLRSVGHPYAVSPSAALKREAEEKGWPVLDWKIRE